MCPDPAGAPQPADSGGFVVAVAAVAEAVNGLVAEPATAERMGAAGRKRAVGEFSWPSVAERTVALYRWRIGAF